MYMRSVVGSNPTPGRSVFVCSCMQSYNQMDQYAEVVGSDASREDYLRIAVHFQKTVDHFRAGQFFHKAGEHAKVHVHPLY